MLASKKASVYNNNKIGVELKTLMNDLEHPEEVGDDASN
jgi:hypothetical protein